MNDLSRLLTPPPDTSEATTESRMRNLNDIIHGGRDLKEPRTIPYEFIKAEALAKAYREGLSSGDIPQAIIDSIKKHEMLGHVVEGIPENGEF